jgi:transcriptional regulator with XRE-family HTH domain
MTLHDIETARTRLRELIEDRELMRKQVAAHCGVKPQTVTGWLKDESIPLEQLNKLAALFNVDPRYMRGEDVAFEHLCMLRVEAARCEGLLRGLIYRRTRVDTAFREDTTQMYWGALIKESRGLLDVVDLEWEKSIAPLLRNLADKAEFSETYVRIVLQVCHYLSDRMRFGERIELARTAAEKAKVLAASAVAGSSNQQNWRAATLILRIDGLAWASIELGRTDGLAALLESAEHDAQSYGLSQLATLARIFLARARLYEGVSAAQTLEIWYARKEENAREARKVLDTIRNMDREDYILMNRYSAVKAEIVLAARQYDEAVYLHNQILQQAKPEMEMSVGTHCSLAYAWVEKAVAVGGWQRDEAMEATKDLPDEDDKDKLWSEQLLTDIARVRRLEIQGHRKEALVHARNTWGLFVGDRGILEHNLILLLKLLISRLESPV